MIMVMSKAHAGTLGGLVKSTAKTDAVRINGLKGGRPPKYPCRCGKAMHPIKRHPRMLKCIACGRLDKLQ